MKLPIILGITAFVTGAIAWWPAGERPASDLIKTGTVLGVADPKPDQVASLRVATWDNESKTAKAFEVAKKDGAWVIPSHEDYPADGGTRVGKTAGGVLGVRPGRKVGNDAKLLKDLELLDPLDDASLGDEGRGKRVTVKDQTGATMVDLIVGKPVTGGEGNFVREAGSNEVYTAKVNTDISTKFIDWVEPDLLKVGREDIRSIAFHDYTLDPQQHVVATTAEVSRADGAGDWTSQQAPADKRVGKAAVDKLLTEITGLRLAGVQRLLPQVLEQRGFFLVPDPALLGDPTSLVLNTNRGKAVLVGSQGGLAITTKAGVRYQCFFGEAAVGEEGEDAKKAEAKDGKDAKAEGHDRYMVVFVQYDPKADEDTRKKAEDDARKAAEKKEGEPPKEEKKDTVPAGKTKAEKAQKKFAQFFYVISDKSFKELHPLADTLFEAKPAEPQAGSTGKTNQQWLAENGAKPGVTTTASGLQYEVIEASKMADPKQPQDGDTVEVMYKGSLIDGTEFDASKNGPASFNVNGVIKGWTEALKLMKEGDHWRLSIPPELGYGEAGSPPKIGPNAILIFEVSLDKVGP